MISTVIVNDLGEVKGCKFTNKYKHKQPVTSYNAAISTSCLHKRWALYPMVTVSVLSVLDSVDKKYIGFEQQQNKHCITQERIESSTETHTPLKDHSDLWTILKTCSRGQKANPAEIVDGNYFFTCLDDWF